MTITNQQRTEKAYRVLLGRYFEDAADIEAGITDMAVDLLHLGEEYGLDPHELQYRAMSHYRAEVSREQA